MTGKQLKNSILQWAIQGKLVPQDPNDEPASVLLERIRKEKEQLIADGKAKSSKKLAPISDIEKPFDTSEYKLEKQDGEFFFIKDIKHNVELKFNPSTDYSEYFTYINPKDKKEYKYENSIIEWRKDLNCYVGKI